jgi:mRNA interferase MazF
MRPALVVQEDEQNRKLLNTIVAMVSSNLRHATQATQHLIELSGPDGKQSGLRQDSTVNCTKLYTIEQIQVLRTLGSLSKQSMRKVDECLKKALGIK